MSEKEIVIMLKIEMPKILVLTLDNRYIDKENTPIIKKLIKRIKK